MARLPFHALTLAGIALILVLSALPGSVAEEEAPPEEAVYEMRTTERPFVLITRDIPDKVRAGRPFTVSVTATNAGESAAFEVSLDDSAWSIDTFLFDTEASKNYVEMLDSKENMTITYTVKPRSSGTFTIPDAKVAYKAYGEDANQLYTGISSASGGLRAMGAIESNLQIFSFIFSIFNGNFFAAAGEWYYFIVFACIIAGAYFALQAYEKAKLANKLRIQKMFEKELMEEKKKSK